MPRKPLGESAKTKVIAVRVTEEEHRALVAKYGSPTRALRALVIAAIRSRA